MAHQSEEVKPLDVVSVLLDEIGQLCVSDKESHIWLLILPYGRLQTESEKEKTWLEHLHKFVDVLPDDSVLCILTTPVDAVNTWIQLADVLYFQLWIAVKLKKPILNKKAELPEQHASLLVMTKYQTPLRHNKTRIAYTYCPACDKTTKDYGGKKHIYHEYGTLMSDIWRDIAFSPDDSVDQIIGRLKDMFGLSPYKQLNVVDLRKIQTLQPKKRGMKTVQGEYFKSCASRICAHKWRQFRNFAIHRIG